MSIWSSTRGAPLPGWDYDAEDFSADPTMTVGVATTWHPVARLAIRGDGGTSTSEDGTILLRPAELRELATRLTEAAELIERLDHQPPQPTDHRAQAERWLKVAANYFDGEWPSEVTQAAALIGIGHALLAGPARELERPPYATVGQTAPEHNAELDAYWQRNR